MLAVVDRRQRQVGAELDGTGAVDDDVDGVRAGQRGVVVGDGDAAGGSAVTRKT